MLHSWDALFIPPRPCARQTQAVAHLPSASLPSSQHDWMVGVEIST